MIRRQQRHAALAHAVEDQKGARVLALHHDVPAFRRHVDLAQPGPPGVLAAEVRRHRVALAEFRYRGPEARVDHPRGGFARHDLGQRRAIEAVRPREIGTRGEEDGAALAHVVRHVFEVDRGQDAAPLVAVEDDQVEIADLFQEQLARREGDQAQFVDGHAVLLFRGAQDGEVHKVHRAVGFQKVPPGAAALVRFARDQQHAQPVAHAVHLDQRGVVAVGQFAVGHRQGELQHVAPAMGQRHRQFQVLPDRHLDPLRFLAVDRNVERRHDHPRRHGARILDPQGQGHGFADDGKGGGVADDQATVPVALAPGQQDVQWRGQVGGAFDVVQPPIGQRDDARDAGARFLGDGFRDGGHQLGPGVAFAVVQGDAAQFRVLARGDAFGQVFGGGICLCGAVGQGLAGAAVLDHDHDVGQGRAVFLLVDGTRQRRDDGGGGQRPQAPARQAPQPRQKNGRQRHRHDREQRGPRDQRIEDDGSGHWPSLSRSAGTCTWSDL